MNVKRQFATNVILPGDAAPRPEYTGSGLLSRLEPRASLMRHKRLAASLFLLITLAGLPIAYFESKPAYYTQAVVSIAPRVTMNAQGEGELKSPANAEHHDYVQRNLRTLNRHDIVMETLKQLGDDGKRWWRRPWESDRLAAERLAHALTISAAPDAHQMIVGLKGDRPEGLEETVNTLVDVYIRVQRFEENRGAESRRGALRQELDSLEKELAAGQARRAQLARETGVSDFTENYINPYDQLLAPARQALAEARRQRIMPAGEFGTVDPARGGASTLTLDSYALEMVSNAPANLPLVSSANTRRVELTARLGGLSPEHMGSKALMQEPADFEQSQAEAPRAERMERTLAAEVAQQESRASRFAAKYQEGISLGQRIEQARKRQESLEEQRRLPEPERQEPGIIRMLSKAQPARLPVEGGRNTFALIFALAGFVTALLVPVAIDIADPLLFVPSGAGRALGFDPLGWLPEREEGGEEFTWELILRLANRMDQQRQAHGTRIWMFTSVKPGGGTTTLVNSLGRALNLLGIPTLAVEANAYRADGRFARNAVGPGLTALLRGRSTLGESIEAADEEMPDHIPVGELDGSGHLPVIHRLMKILGDATESYALVLVDMPPVSVSLDSEYLARRSDCVVLVAEARRVTAPELKRAARVLQRIQPKALTCIVNRVRATDGGGFAHNAKREFETGAGKPLPTWPQPWPWR